MTVGSFRATSIQKALAVPPSSGALLPPPPPPPSLLSPRSADRLRAEVTECLLSPLKPIPDKIRRLSGDADQSTKAADEAKEEMPPRWAIIFTTDRFKSPQSRPARPAAAAGRLDGAPDAPQRRALLPARGDGRRDAVAAVRAAPDVHGEPGRALPAHAVDPVSVLPAEEDGRRRRCGDAGQQQRLSRLVGLRRPAAAQGHPSRPTAQVLRRRDAHAVGVDRTAAAHAEAEAGREDDERRVAVREAAENRGAEGG